MLVRLKRVALVYALNTRRSNARRVIDGIRENITAFVKDNLVDGDVSVPFAVVYVPGLSFCTLGVVDELDDRVTALEAANEGLRTTLAAVAGRNAQFHKDNAELRDRNDQVLKDNKELRESNKELRTELEALRERLDTVLKLIPELRAQ